MSEYSKIRERMIELNTAFILNEYATDDDKEETFLQVLVCAIKLEKRLTKFIKENNDEDD